MPDTLIGQIILFAGTFIPNGWLLCDVSSQLITTYLQLFTLIGTTYGGDGQTHFNLPDLRGRAPIGAGVIKNEEMASIIPQQLVPIPDSTNTKNLPSGQKSGNNHITLTATNLPSHTHSLAVCSGVGSASSADPTGNYLANTDPAPDAGSITIGSSVLLFGTTPNGYAGPQAIGLTGAGNSVAFEVPYIAMNYIIATTGIYPVHS